MRRGSTCLQHREDLGVCRVALILGSVGPDGVDRLPHMRLQGERGWGHGRAGERSPQAGRGGADSSVNCPRPVQRAWHACMSSDCTPCPTPPHATHARKGAAATHTPCLRGIALEVLVCMQRRHRLVDVEQLTGGRQLADARARLRGCGAAGARAGVQGGGGVGVDSGSGQGCRAARAWAVGTRMGAREALQRSCK